MYETYLYRMYMKHTFHEMFKTFHDTYKKQTFHQMYTFHEIY